VHTLCKRCPDYSKGNSQKNLLEKVSDLESDRTNGTGNLY
jgi:hypothetical protein